MCHGHVDLRTIEREVQDRLRAVKPAVTPSGDEADSLPPMRVPGWLGRLARTGAALASLRPVRGT
jgi:hypothetical protein